MSPHILAFAGVAAVLTLIPGADTALVTRNTLTEGRRAALATTLGICSGLSVHATASALGLSAILRVSAIAYAIVRLVGAAYLAYLGVQTLCGAGEKKKGVNGTSQAEITSRQANREASWRCFRQGVFTNLLNPKVALFYLTILPQFVSPKGSVLLQSLLLASIHIAMGLVWLSVYAYFLSGFRGVMNRPIVKSTLERVTGGLLLGLGLRLAWERR